MMKHKDTKKEIKRKGRRNLVLVASKQLINTPLTQYMATMMIKHVKHIAAVEVTGLRQLLLDFDSCYFISSQTSFTGSKEKGS